MVVFFPVALQSLAIASTIIATLRAGSRAVYLIQQPNNSSGIGLIPGPTIDPPTKVRYGHDDTDETSHNETTTASDDDDHGGNFMLWELSEAFRHAVRLEYATTVTPDNNDIESDNNDPLLTSNLMHSYEHIERKVPIMTIAKDDEDSTYSLYFPRPSSSSLSTTSTVTTASDSITVSSSGSSIGSDDTSGGPPEEFLRRTGADANNADETTLSTNTEETGETAVTNMDLLEYSSPTRSEIGRLAKATAWIGSISRNLHQQVASSPQTIIDGCKRFWQRKDGMMILVDSMEGEAEDNFDYTLSTKAQMRYINSNKKSSSNQRWTANDSPPARVADLTVFAPETFQQLRSQFGISSSAYWKSVFESGSFVSFQSNSKGAARVGGVFFFTPDGAYMIKSIKSAEAKTLLKMLPRYHKHMRRFGRNSLLNRFCGMYGVRIHNENSLDHGKLHTFVVMNAVFPPDGSQFIAERFDLKGSTVGREVSEEELRTQGSNAVLKDLDLAREVQAVKEVDETIAMKPNSSLNSQRSFSSPKEFGLNFGAKRKAALLSQLRQDVKFLEDCQVMDYSLLVGVIHMSRRASSLDHAERQALAVFQDQARKERFSKSRKWEDRLLWKLGTPLRLVAAPPAFLGRKAWAVVQRTWSSVVTYPLPYYGSGNCGVSGGSFSVIPGHRNGERAVYYLGLIDFLQPWTTRKVVERKLKGWILRYDINAVSSVSPEEYAARFMEFLDDHIS